TEPSQTAAVLIAALPGVSKAQLDGTTLRCTVASGGVQLGQLLDKLADEHVGYRRVYSEPPTLNDVFLAITGTELRD
ncbi:MAG: DUF4162 domain-containing protein, partial [Propionibacteriaceae bacterium]|nr:DUF4162 domain-containing protein [Propionibacteriaceae bacterium]